MKNPVHDHYVSCAGLTRAGCGAQFSNTIEKCPACGKANPEFVKTAYQDRDTPDTERAPTERPPAEKEVPS